MKLAFAASTALLCFSAAHAAVAPQRTADFTGKIAIEILSGDAAQSSWPTALNPSRVSAALSYINASGKDAGGHWTGIGVIRDQVWGVEDSYGCTNKKIKCNVNSAPLIADGYYYDVYPWYQPNVDNDNSQLVDDVTAVGLSHFKLIEGPLEVDQKGLVNGVTTYTGVRGTVSGWLAALSWQEDIKAAFPNATISQYSLADPQNGCLAYNSAIGCNAASPVVAVANAYNINIGTISTQGNVHYYQKYGASPGEPRAIQIYCTEPMTSVINKSTAVVAGKPFVVTETGYSILNDVPCNGNNTGMANDETAQGLYTLYGVFDAIKAGATLVNIYQLFDKDAGTCNAGTGDQGCYGIYRQDGLTKKLAATYLHNFFSIVSDTAATNHSFSPTPVNITGLSANSLVLQKANGHYQVILWGDYSSFWGGVRGAEPNNILLSFNASMGHWAAYDPTVSATPFASGVLSSGFGTLSNSHRIVVVDFY